MEEVKKHIQNEYKESAVNEHTTQRKRDHFATVLSVLALAISVIGIILTSPLIIEYYDRPQLVGSASIRYENSTFVNHEFTVRNTGRSMATGIEIEVYCLPTDSFEVLFGPSDVSTQKKNQSIDDVFRLQQVFIRASRLTPNEHITFSVSSQVDELSNTNQFLNHKQIPIRLPCFRAILYDQGIAEVR